MRYPRMAVAALLLPVLAQGQEADSAWENCTKDRDCVVIQGVCRAASVNAAAKEAASAHYAQRAKKERCPQEFWHPANPVPHCRLGRCELIEKSSK